MADVDIRSCFNEAIMSLSDLEAALRKAGHTELEAEVVEIFKILFKVENDWIDKERNDG